jgi:outer membrane biosynthesis protein TonB
VDGFLKMLVALMAALNAATGAPVDVNNMPDRPPIMIPTLAPLPTQALGSAAPSNEAAGARTISGTITNIQEGFVFVNGVPVLLAPATQVNGQLRVGLDVQVQARLRADGVLEADTLDLREHSDLARETAQPVEQTHKASADEPFATPTLLQEAKPASPEIKPTEDVRPQANEKPEVKSTEKPAAQPTEKAKVEPTAQPAAQPTAKIQVEPTEKPPAQPSTRPSDDGGRTVPNVTTTQPVGRSGDSGMSSDSSKDGSEVQPKGD